MQLGVIESCTRFVRAKNFWKQSERRSDSLSPGASAKAAENGRNLSNSNGGMKNVGARSRNRDYLHDERTRS